MRVSSEWIGFDLYLHLVAAGGHEGVTMYHRAPWLQAVAASFKAHVLAVHTVDAGGASFALTPFILKCKGPFRLLGSPLSGMHTEFAGPLFAPGLGREERNVVMRSQHTLVASRAQYVEWGGKGGGDAPSDVWGGGLAHLGYVYTARPTRIIDLTRGEASVWAGFEGRARNTIRKAEKSGVKARTVAASESWIQKYYAMLQDTYRRQGRNVPHPLVFYENILPLAKASKALFIAAETDGRMVAGGIFLIDGHRMLYLSGTASAEGMKLAASSLIQWHAMRTALTHGVTEYDMGGLGVPSIDSFKRSFGGREIAHHRWVYRSRLYSIIEPLAIWAVRRGLIRLGD